jgi:hypothetical protein
MATRLDQQIEQLENIVEARLNLCQATWYGIRCTLPRNHTPTDPHRFPIEFSPDIDLSAHGGAIANQKRSRFAETDISQK